VTLAPRKRKTTSTHNRHAVRDADGKLTISEDLQQTRAKEPIFGPAVPAGEEFEYTTLACTTQAEVRDEIAGLMYDVLNGYLPQQKGEFALRALSQMTKSLRFEADAKGPSGVAEKVADLLRDDALPSLKDSLELSEFARMANESDPVKK